MSSQPIKTDLPWETLASERIFENPWFALRQDQVRTHTGAEITYTFMQHPGVVAVVPVTADGQIVLIRQYRHTVKDWCWEIPMGGRDEDNSEQVARKEVFEEAGGTCRDLKYIAAFYAINGVGNIRCEVYLATGVELGASQPEAGELIEIAIETKDEVMRMARAGEITCGMSALALFLCEHHFADQRPVTGDR
ncbi:MAG: NUDIX hydrolase [Chloroflexota bacterium]